MKNEHVCPMQMAGLLDNWMRRLIHNPGKIFDGLIEKGQSVLDLGCGPGTFTIDLAKITGEKGKVYAADLQEGMLKLVEKKSQKYNVQKQVILCQCNGNSLGVSENVDFVLAFYMLHESGNPKLLLKQIWDVLNPMGRFLLVEPKMHIKKELYLQTIESAKNIGFSVDSEKKIPGSWAIVLKKN